MKPERDTTTHSKDEIVRRLSYLLYLATAVGGLGLLIAAAVKKDLTYAAAAAVAIGLNLVLHRLGRTRFRFDGLKRDVRGNPFKQAEEDHNNTDSKDTTD